MKKIMISLLIIITILCSGCSIKLPCNMVELPEAEYEIIDKGYKKEDIYIEDHYTHEIATKYYMTFRKISTQTIYYKVRVTEEFYNEHNTWDVVIIKK